MNERVRLIAEKGRERERERERESIAEEENFLEEDQCW